MTALTVLAVGDLILDEPDPGSFFAPARPVLATGDVVIGHVETPYTTTPMQSVLGVPAPPVAPAQLDALPQAGFTVATLAGNHVFDQGHAGVRDTLEALRSAGLQTAGAGMTLGEACQPALVKARGRTVAVLSYNTVGPRESWAGPGKPGCAYVHVLTHYELDHASPGGRPRVYTFAAPESIEAMEDDIRAAHEASDLLVVALHKGINGATIPQWYEKQLAHAAIDAGADIVIGHHPHIMAGIEVHRERPIYHGLGNFVTVTRALSTNAAENADPERLAHARRRKELFGFEPDPAMPSYPFHPDSRHTIIARCVLDDEGQLHAGFVPCYIDRHGRPCPVTRGGDGERVFDYIARITAEAGFRTELRWSGDGLAEIRLAGDRA
jgi:poly-gamma-glutamate capsule biosynthesis protein CapA/YwtB (metallophosphatase superfamily)